METILFIVNAAKWYVGRIEKKGNTGFYDAGFEAELKAAGWYYGAPWCAFFANMVWRKLFKSNDKLNSLINKLDSGSAQQTFKNYKNDGTFKTGDIPKVGAKVIWQLGDSQNGHEGIVVDIDIENNTMTTVEGNTNAHGSREGNCVAIKYRTIERAFSEKGLNVVGYIYPEIAA